MSIYAFLIDLILLVIIGLAVYFAARKGFVRTVVEAVGILAAVIITLTICTPLANMTYDKMIEPVILESAEEKINTSFGGQLDKVSDLDMTTEEVEEFKSQIKASVVDFLEKMPPVVQKFIKESGFKSDEILEDSEDGINKEGTIGDTAQKLVKDISQTKIKPIVVELLSALYSFVTLAVLLIIVKILAVSLNKVFSFSFAGRINTFLGGVCGLVKGLVFAFLFCIVIYMVISFTENGSWIFTYENIEKTLIFKTLIGLIKI